MLELIPSYSMLGNRPRTSRGDGSNLSIVVFRSNGVEHLAHAAIGLNRLEAPDRTRAHSGVRVVHQPFENSIPYSHIFRYVGPKAVQRGQTDFAVFSVPQGDQQSLQNRPVQSTDAWSGTRQQAGLQNPAQPRS